MGLIFPDELSALTGKDIMLKNVFSLVYILIDILKYKGSERQERRKKLFFIFSCY